ncbi:MAG: hypothetical protein SCALA702_22110 [Melioribacteraceae bacterium]|nr:MAG: hypothetical protein SCALA702_22110 [Melioribacteraceae bacterium]
MRLNKLVLLPILLLIFSQAGCQSDDNPSEPETGSDEYTLVWSDEFDYTGKPDSTKWGYDIGDSGWGNNELQYYTDDEVNSRAENGHLVIEAHQYPDAGVEYTSARIVTRGKGDWLYGRIEVKARLPYGQGIWPAIWMLPTDWVYGGWAASGEIDIMELLGHQPETVYGTIHYGGTSPNNVHTGESITLQNGSFASDFHVFVFEWEENEMRWYIDDNLYATQTEWHSTGHDYPAPFNRRFHLILNIAVGGNWPGYPDENTTFPQRMEVDYIRVYQKN